MKTRCIVIGRDDQGKTPETLKPNLEQHAEVRMKRIKKKKKIVPVIFLMTHSEPEIEV